MCADTYEELLWHWSFTTSVVAVVTLTTATEVMQSLEDRRLAHVGLTMVAIIFFDSANIKNQWHKRFSLFSVFVGKFEPNQFKMDQ